MANPLGARSLELEVSNFGPIAEARIELRPLSVFVGPSNTGQVLHGCVHLRASQAFSEATFTETSDFLRCFAKSEPFVRDRRDVASLKEV